MKNDQIFRYRLEDSRTRLECMHDKTYKFILDVDDEDDCYQRTGRKFKNITWVELLVYGKILDVDGEVILDGNDFKNKNTK